MLGVDIGINGWVAIGVGTGMSIAYLAHATYIVSRMVAFPLIFPWAKP